MDVKKSQSKYLTSGLVEAEYDDMEFRFDDSGYVKNHSVTFVLPDPSHGQSQGSNWTGELDFFIKCQDKFGHESPEFYVVDMCVVEGDDITGPLIRGTEPVNDIMVGVDVTSQNVVDCARHFIPGYQYR